MSIKEYLESSYQAKTAASYLLEWEHFKMYLEGLNISLQGVTYLLILDYVRQLQNQGLKPVSINRKLVVIEAVYEGLGILANNPTRSFRVKRATRPAVQEPLKIEQLEDLLKKQPSNTPQQQRAKLILSLIHNQALRLSELQALELEHVDLEQAILEVPSIRRSNPRELLLEARQIKLLDAYIQESRPQLLRFETTQLILTGGSSSRLANVLQKLQRKLKKQLPELQNLEHWRSSIIVHWLSHEPLLEVQQKLGHRYASSTERYQLQAVESLQKSLKKYHPLED